MLSDAGGIQFGKEPQRTDNDGKRGDDDGNTATLRRWFAVRRPGIGVGKRMLLQQRKQEKVQPKTDHHGSQDHNSKAQSCEHVASGDCQSAPASLRAVWWRGSESLIIS